MFKKLVIICIINILIFALMIGFSIYKTIQAERVCKEAYFVQRSLSGRDVFMGYIDETTIKEVREMAGDELIFKGEKCVRIK